MTHDNDFYRREAEDIGREYADRDRDRARDSRPRVVSFENAELDATALTDAVDVIAEGQQIAKDGIRYRVPGLIPNYGMLGMSVAYREGREDDVRASDGRGRGDRHGVSRPDHHPGARARHLR
jgi:hypothetical protein